MTQRSVNAFRALGRIILHRSVRVTSGPYFAHNTVYAYRLFFHNPLFHRPVIYRSSYKYIYLLIGFRASCSRHSPFVGIRQIFIPLARKRSSLLLSPSSKKNFVGNNFYPRISTLLNLLLIELQQLPPVFLLTFPLEMRPTVTSTLLRRRYSRYQSAVIAKMLEKCISNLQILYRIKKKNKK